MTAIPDSEWDRKYPQIVDDDADMADHGCIAMFGTDGHTWFCTLNIGHHGPHVAHGGPSFGVIAVDGQQYPLPGTVAARMLGADEEDAADES